ncbi:hypothetical protein quinque_013846 [Culex quinquefasciatus]
MIETAHLNSDDEISLSTLGRTYTIDFHSMQRVNGDTGTTRTVQRKINHALLAQPQGTMIITAGTPTTLHHTNHQRMSTTAARHHQPEAGSSKRSRLYQTRPHLSGTYAYNAELGILTFPLSIARIPHTISQPGPTEGVGHTEAQGRNPRAAANQNRVLTMPREVSHLQQCPANLQQLRHPVRPPPPPSCRN